MIEADNPGIARALVVNGARSIAHIDGRAVVATAVNNAATLKDITWRLYQGYATGDHDDAEIGRIIRQQVEVDLKPAPALFEFEAEITVEHPDGDTDVACVVAITDYEPADPGNRSGHPDSWLPSCPRHVDGEIRDRDGYPRWDWQDSLSDQAFQRLLDAAADAFETPDKLAV